MSTPDPIEARRTPRHSEQGNIALVTALLVMALAGVGIGMARFVQMQSESSAEMRLSNYAGTLAQNVAESAINQVLYNWMSGVTPGVVNPAVSDGNGNAQTGTLTAFPDVATNYGAFGVSSHCGYTVAVADGGPANTWIITAVGTVTANGAALPSLPWRTVSRTVQATVQKASPYAVVGFARL